MFQRQGSLSKVFPLEAPNPDFQKLRRVLAGEEKADRVHFAELAVDAEVMQVFLNMMGRDFPVSEVNRVRQQKVKQLMEGKKKSISLLTTKEEETLIKSHIEFYYRMGYDFVPGLSPSLIFLWMFKPKTRKTRDTAALSKTFDAFSGDDAGGNRVWIEETQGIITSWEDMPWAVQILLVTICLFQIIWLC